MSKQGVIAVSLMVGLAGGAMSAIAQPSTRLEYQVAVDGGAWGASVGLLPGQRAEWRAVLTFTGTQAAAALGSIAYQPVFSNVDNSGAGTAVDSLGVFRGPPGVGAILSLAEGANSGPLATYGRVGYRGSPNLSLDSFRHSAGSGGAPAGEYIRIAQAGFSNWASAGSVISENSSATSTNFISGTQSMVIFRQAFIASTDVSPGFRFVTLTSSADPGAVFARWALAGEGGPTASLTSEIQFVPAVIQIIPTPTGLALAGLTGLGLLRRQRR